MPLVFELSLIIVHMHHCIRIKAQKSLVQQSFALRGGTTLRLGWSVVLGPP